MKKLVQIVKTRRLLLTAFASLSLGVLVVAIGPSRRQDVQVKAVSPNEVKIINNTTSLDVTFYHTRANNLLVRVKNISSKDLNGYVFGMNDARVTNDISSGDRVVSPGETDEVELPIRSSTTLTILGVMFADGTIEAEPVLKKELSESRLGLKKELIRNLAVLDEVLSSPDAYSKKGLDLLEDKFSLRGNAETRSHSESGAHSAREDLNSELKSLKQRQQREGSGMQIQQLLDLKGRIERRIARL